MIQPPTGSPQPATVVVPPFEEQIPFIQEQIEHRKRTWTLTTLEWQDVKQMVLIRIWQKYHLFDPNRGPFEHWLNRSISNALTNILRDNLLRWARPCIRDGGCVYNLGTGHCGFTKSGLQCAECPLYAKWQDKKESEYNVKASLALEHHAQEVANVQSDFMDIEGKKRIIDEKMKKELTRWERNIYRLVYIEHKTPAEAVKELKRMVANRKRPLGPDDPIEYQDVLKTAKVMKQMMLLIIEREDLI